MPDRARGRVMALEANYCRVRLDSGATLLCTRRSRLAHGGQQVCVGDWVQVDGIDWVQARGAVAAVEPRRSLLQRPPLANADRVVVMVALARPAPEADALSRFLLAAEATGLEVLVLFSKADLVPPDHLACWQQRLQGWGYGPLGLSHDDPASVAAVGRRLAQGVSVLCGPSGVGKSSLLNALIPGLALRTAAVSGRLERGRHTTRHVELHDLGAAALLADTPGFNRPDLPTDPQHWPLLFPEIRRQLQAGSACRFRDCRHGDEPGCAIARDWERYGQYRDGLAVLSPPGPDRAGSGRR
ncbi:MAG: ribosome small subunit-dependent GTPase A [Prochlorococcaceae cyanobacterium]